MAHVMLFDGTIKQVSYDQAARIKQVLDGTKEPKDAEQEAFCMTVQSVHFDKLNQPLAPTDRFNGKDEVLQQILVDESLTGYEKFKAVAMRLKER